MKNFDQLVGFDAYISIYRTLAEIRGDGSLITYYLFGVPRRRVAKNGGVIYYHIPRDGGRFLVLSNEPIEDFKLIQTVPVSPTGYRISRKLLGYLGIFESGNGKKIPIGLRVGTYKSGKKEFKVAIIEPITAQ